MFTRLIEDYTFGLTSSQALLAALAFASVILIGASILFLHEQRQRAVRKRLMMSGTADVPARSTQESRFLRFLEQIGNFISHGHASTSLWEQMIRAGYMSRGAPAIYTGIKMLFFAIGLAVTAFFVFPGQQSTVQKTVWISLGGLIPFFVPNFAVLIRESKRREEIRQHLPDAIDLLEICVTAGIGLDMAWNLVADEIRHVSSVLASAMDLSNFEIHLGASRTEAMRNMATRTGAEQLSSLAAILVQSERFGTSVADTLREFATWMREERHMTAEERAEKMPTKMLFPMALFIFPAIMVIAIGPAMIHISRTLSIQ
jgi:tight adherence protein C